MSSIFRLYRSSISNALRTRQLQHDAAQLRMGLRNFCSSLEPYQMEIDSINEKFAEAREEIQDATDDAETVYFNESCDEASKVADDVLQQWDALLNKLPEGAKGALQRSMGLKMEQLKAELQQLKDLHAD